MTTRNEQDIKKLRDHCAKRLRDLPLDDEGPWAIALAILLAAEHIGDKLDESNDRITCVANAVLQS